MAIDLGNKRVAYFILESQMNGDGEYNVLVAVEGESGYYKTDWFWGRDLKVAEQIVRTKNEALGISVEDAYEIVLSSMRKGAIETPRF